jgi:hypothetical protein
MGGGNLTLSTKKQRIAPPPPHHSLDTAGGGVVDGGVESFISQFQRDFPLSSNNKDTKDTELVEGGEEGDRTGAPMEIVTSKDEFIKRAEFIRGQTLIVTNGKESAITDRDTVYDLKFAVFNHLPVKDVLFRPGIFFIENGNEWGRPAKENTPRSNLRTLHAADEGRNYNKDPFQTNRVIAGLMESSWRDFHFLCAEVIRNYNEGRFTFTPGMSLRLPFWDDKPSVDLFRAKPADEITVDFLQTPEAKKEPWSILFKNLDVNWFQEDLPMFSPVQRTPEQERLYLLSCLDKAAFISDYGSLFQKRMGFDVAKESLASPFLVEPWEHHDNETTDLVVKEFKARVDAINEVIEAFRTGLEEQLKQVEARGEGLPMLFENKDAKEGEEKKLVKIIEDKVVSFIEKNLTNPIANSIKKIVSLKDTEVALKDSQLRVKKLERQLFKFTTNGGGALASTMLGGLPGEVSKTRKLYLETAIRFEVQKRLRAEFPLFRFGDQLAGTAAIVTQRVLRFDFDELITRDVADKVLPDIGDKELPNIQAYYERSLTPFKESFNSLNLFAPSTQAAITVCLERVKLMTFMGGKGGRSGRREILVEDLTAKNQELSVAFATLVALELQVNQEVQRKTSSTHHDQIKLAASVQNADNLMRGLLIKHGWACYPNQFDEANSTRGVVRPGGF